MRSRASRTPLRRGRRYDVAGAAQGRPSFQLGRYAFIAALTASAVIGSERTRAPTALKTALPIAGAMTVTAGSPQPTAGSPLAMMLMSISGILLIRIGV